MEKDERNRFRPGGDHVENIVRRLVRINRWEKQLELYSIFLLWEQLVAEEISEHAKPVRIDRDVLWLEVENSSWMTEFQYRRVEIEDGVNSRLISGRIREVRMALPKKGKTFTPRSPLRPQVVEGIPPSEEEHAAFCALAESIEDTACRESLISCWYSLRSYGRG